MLLRYSCLDTLFFEKYFRFSDEFQVNNTINVKAKC